MPQEMLEFRVRRGDPGSQRRLQGRLPRGRDLWAASGKVLRSQKRLQGRLPRGHDLQAASGKVLRNQTSRLGEGRAHGRSLTGTRLGKGLSGTMPSLEPRKKLSHPALHPLLALSRNG